jgi:nucleoside-diphosphate-sugar epimerase
MVFVTGGTGFLGAHLMYQLLRKGVQIRALKRPESKMDMLERVLRFYEKNYRDILLNISWVEGDLLDIYSLKEVLSDVSVIYHSAGVVSFTPDDKKAMMDVNIKGTANLVNMALEKRINRFCHVSSIAALGRSEDSKIIDELTVWQTSNRNSRYAISKYGAEREVWRGIQEGLNAVIVSPSIILGPGKINAGTGKLIETIQKGLKFYTAGMNGFVDVRDVVNVMIELVESDIAGERFIVSSENLTYKQLFEMISRELGKSPPTLKASRWIGEMAWRYEYVKGKITGNKPLITRETADTASNNYSYSNQKITDQLNYRFIPIEQTISEACDYYVNKLVE